MAGAQGCSLPAGSCCLFLALADDFLTLLADCSKSGQEGECEKAFISVHVSFYSQFPELSEGPLCVFWVWLPVFGRWQADGRSQSTQFHFHSQPPAFLPRLFLEVGQPGPGATLPHKPPPRSGAAQATVSEEHSHGPPEPLRARWLLRTPLLVYPWSRCPKPRFSPMSGLTWGVQAGRGGGHPMTGDLAKWKGVRQSFIQEVQLRERDVDRNGREAKYRKRGISTWNPTPSPGLQGSQQEVTGTKQYKRGKDGVWYC